MERKKEQSKVREKAIAALQLDVCLFCTLLGIYCCAAFLFKVSVRLITLLAIAALVCLGVRILRLGKKWIIYGILFAILMVFLQWKQLLLGAKLFANNVLILINEYYDTELIGWYVRKEPGAFLLFFLCLLAFAGVLEGMVFFAVRKKRVCFLWRILIPAILIIAGLSVGKAPDVSGIFWLSAGILAGQLEPGQKGSLLIVGMSIGILGVAVIFANSFLAETLLKNHDQWLRIQWKMEDYAMDVLNKIENQIFYQKEPLTTYALDNQKPVHTGEEIFRITVEELPTESVYIKGFVGTEYKDGVWLAASEQPFIELAQQSGTAPKEYAKKVMNRPFESIQYLLEQNTIHITNFEFSKDMSQSAAEVHPRKPQEVTIQMKAPSTDYTLFPYYTELTSKSGFLADGALKPDGETTYQYRSYLTLPEELNAQGAGMQGIAWWGLEYTDIFQDYSQYVTRRDTLVPKEKLSRLVSHVEAKQNAQQMSASAESQVKGLLWEDTSYSLNLEAVPEGEDYVEFFLLEQKKGYCVNYATAGTLLFRLYGVPARYVTGYMIPPLAFRQNENGTYTAKVTDENSHAWTEIFENNVGFYPVEVTPPDYTEALEQKKQEESLEAVVSEVEQKMEQRQNRQKEPLPENQTKEETTAQPPAKSSEERQQGLAERAAQAAINQKKIDKKVNGILLAILIVLALSCITLMQRRRFVLKRQQQLFTQEDHQKAVLAIGKEMVRMLRALRLFLSTKQTEREYIMKIERKLPCEGVADWDRCRQILQKAAFSMNEVSAEECQFMRKHHNLLWKNMREQKGMLVILYWKYIKNYA